MAYSIDTLATSHTLQEAGFNDKQAEAIAVVMGTQGDELATKDDLANIETKITILATKADLAELRASTKADTVSIETKITTLATKDDVAVLKDGMAVLKDGMSSIEIKIVRLHVAFLTALMVASGIVIAATKLF